MSCTKIIVLFKWKVAEHADGSWPVWSKCSCMELQIGLLERILRWNAGQAIWREDSLFEA